MIADLPTIFEAARKRNEHEWMARCPAHEDRTPSLSIKRGEDAWLLHCLAGCETAEVLRAQGLGWDALMAFEQAQTCPRAAPLRVTRPAGLEQVERRPCAAVEDVRALWAACEPVDGPHDEAMYGAEWLIVERGIHAAAVAQRDLARVLTGRTPLPPWAHYGGMTWYATGHRLLLPTFDHHGVMRGVRARGVLAHTKKELAPQGVRSSGLVFADGCGRRLLEGRTADINHLGPDGWLRVVICEGAPDFLTWASTRNERDPVHAAVFGISSGAWTEAMAARIPDGTHVLIDTDDDEAGRRYARGIARSLGGRCDLYRRRPSTGSRP